MLIRHTQAEDYTAGELNEPFEVVPASRDVDGSQWHCLTYLGSDWGKRNVRYPTERWLIWIRHVLACGGAVTLDMGPNLSPEAGPIGAIALDQAAQFRVLAQQAAAKEEDAKSGKRVRQMRLPVLSGSRVRPMPAMPVAWPLDAKEARRRQAAYARATGLRREYAVVLGGGIKLEMVLIPPGEFRMGSTVDESGRDDDETQRRVTLRQAFYLGKCPVTQAQWDAVLGRNPSKFTGPPWHLQCAAPRASRRG